MKYVCPYCNQDVETTDTYSSPHNDDDAHLTARLEELERRVDHLERTRQMSSYIGVGPNDSRAIRYDE